jgi:hypothetical protein
MADNIMEAPIFIVVSGPKREIGAGKALLIPKILTARAAPSKSEHGHEMAIGTTDSVTGEVYSHNPEH